MGNTVKGRQTRAARAAKRERWKAMSREERAAEKERRSEAARRGAAKRRGVPYIDHALDAELARELEVYWQWRADEEWERDAP